MLLQRGIKEFEACKLFDGEGGRDVDKYGRRGVDLCGRYCTSKNEFDGLDKAGTEWQYFNRKEGRKQAHLSIWPGYN